MGAILEKSLQWCNSQSNKSKTKLTQPGAPLDMHKMFNINIFGQIIKCVLDSNSKF